MGINFNDLKKQQREIIRDILYREHTQYIEGNGQPNQKDMENILSTAYQSITAAGILISKEEIRAYYKTKYKRFNMQKMRKEDS